MQRSYHQFNITGLASHYSQTGNKSFGGSRVVQNEDKLLLNLILHSGL